MARRQKYLLTLLSANVTICSHKRNAPLPSEEKRMNMEDLMLDLEPHVDIKAKPEKAFAAVLHRLGKGNTNPEGQSLQLLLEAKPGGRWYRDRGNGMGHLWGFVQVLKPPTLLELSGPMFMSYPAVNHVEVKIEEVK